MAAVYTGQVTILSIGGVDVLGTFKDATLTLETTTQDARYAMQDWEDPVGRISRWSIDVNTVVDSAEGITLATQLAGAAVAVVFETLTSGGINLTGNALMTTFTRNLPDSDGQDNAIRLTGKGEPTITASS